MRMARAGNPVNRAFLRLQGGLFPQRAVPHHEAAAEGAAALPGRAEEGQEVLPGDELAHAQEIGLFPGSGGRHGGSFRASRGCG